MSEQKYQRVAIFAIALMMVFAIGIYQQAIAVSHYCTKIELGGCQDEPNDEENGSDNIRHPNGKGLD